jgi:hypothetical protein
MLADRNHRSGRREGGLFDIISMSLAALVIIGGLLLVLTIPPDLVKRADLVID